MEPLPPACKGTSVRLCSIRMVHNLLRSKASCPPIGVHGGRGSFGGRQIIIRDESRTGAYLLVPDMSRVLVRCTAAKGLVSLACDIVAPDPGDPRAER